ncbi:hypothetical protein H310_14935 [Aphanomyces invadans]|uniref:Uncharacterized protein n=1 Tax=Aphanomyces invadans TaxID=157072 RepID=A0A024T8B3_9STRA|nr:hypothetical protein H310_14935 [Aphanomyces invadans]ETV90233.1 hypothetical protein H310_14935 [Aphanomyces invadans]|eukprot:XP_008881134.1 hypothetical protein H310_14935 [Aphanomyces invadans]
MTFNVDRSTVRRLWHRASVDITNLYRPCQDISSRKKGHSGRNLKHESVAQRLKLVPKARRKTFRPIAAAMGMPRFTLHDYYRRGIFVKYTMRLKWAMDRVHAVTPDDYAFADMMYVVHVDEKWFFATCVSKSYYLAPDEEPPHRTCKSKKFITKVMFLSAVARPRWDNDRSEWFDGKIGTWLFTEKVPAARTSKNRPAGTLVTVPVSHVRIQQDNAKPHVPPMDPRIVAACQSDGWAMVYQPPNSPDLNVLDLGFFRSIQTLQEQKYPRYIDDIVAGTLQAWREVDMMTLNANFLTLQCCMKEVIRVAGNNSYKVPHMKKAKLAAKGMLPDGVDVDSDTINDGFNLLCATDMDERVEELALEISKAI